MSRLILDSPEIPRTIHQQKPRGKLVHLATVVREVLREGERLSPWLTFPQTGCCFRFGASGSPLPIGALLILWKSYPGVSTCPGCGKETLYMIDFGGLLVIGGGQAVCTSCSESFVNFIGPLITMRNLLTEKLTGTPFPVSGAVFGGAVSDDGYALIQQLGQDNPTVAGLQIQDLYPDAAKDKISLTTVGGQKIKVDV
jgi:hypothetical protein